MKQIYIVDRLEGEYVVLETPEEEMVNVKKSFLEKDIKEGDCLIKKDDYFILDIKETEKRKEKISEMMKGMWVD